MEFECEHMKAPLRKLVGERGQVRSKSGSSKWTVTGLGGSSVFWRVMKVDMWLRACERKEIEGVSVPVEAAVRREERRVAVERPMPRSGVASCDGSSTWKRDPSI